MLQGKITVTSSLVMQLIDITDAISQQIIATTTHTGICSLFNPHTTAGLTINEGCDPAVKNDIITGLQKIVPMHLAYQHLEGNSAAHIMASLMGSSLTIFIEKGHFLLGTWQKIFFCEFDGPRTRTVHWRMIRSEESVTSYL